MVTGFELHEPASRALAHDSRQAAVRNSVACEIAEKRETITLSKSFARQRALYPKEYGDPVHPDESGGSSIVGSHTLIPQALYHSFATFGALMSPELPLSRRQQ
jgi:hypothetical protein